MKPAASSIALFGALALGACAVAPPTGPSVMAMPGPGKSFEQFQYDDATCQQYASAQTGNISPGQAATDSGVASAVVGTALGAAAGAVIGSASGNPGAGAAIGAGSGLVLGSAAGTNNAYASAYALQQRYDMRYIQCMSAKGESVPAAASAPPQPAYPPPAYGAYPHYYAYPAYPYYYRHYPRYHYYPGYPPY
jgi:hypothetical protein